MPCVRNRSASISRRPSSCVTRRLLAGRAELVGCASLGDRRGCFPPRRCTAVGLAEKIYEYLQRRPHLPPTRIVKKEGVYLRLVPIGEDRHKPARGKLRGYIRRPAAA